MPAPEQEEPRPRLCSARTGHQRPVLAVLVPCRKVQLQRLVLSDAFFFFFSSSSFFYYLLFLCCHPGLMYLCSVLGWERSQGEELSFAAGISIGPWIIAGKCTCLD